MEHRSSHRHTTLPERRRGALDLVCIDREACPLYKVALDAELKKRGFLDAPAWSDVVISDAQNSRIITSIPLGVGAIINENMFPEAVG